MNAGQLELPLKFCFWPGFCPSTPEAKTESSSQMLETREYVAKCQRFQGPRPNQLAPVFDEVPEHLNQQILRELERLPSINAVDVREPLLQSFDGNRTSPFF